MLKVRTSPPGQSWEEGKERVVGYQSAYKVKVFLLFEPHGAGVTVLSVSPTLPEITKNNSREKFMVAQVDGRQKGIVCFKLSFLLLPYMHVVKLF